jgi:hypothetical protein
MKNTVVSNSQTNITLRTLSSAIICLLLIAQVVLMVGYVVLTIVTSQKPIPSLSLDNLIICVLSIGSFAFIILGAVFPLIISLCMSQKVRLNISQLILIFSSLLYMIWFIYVAYAAHSALYSTLDPLSLVAVLFIGVYSLPVMLPVWLIISLVECKRAQK